MKMLKFKKKVAVILASTLALSTVLSGCSSSGGNSTGGSADGFELNVCVGPEPESIDPAKNTASD